MRDVARPTVAVGGGETLHQVPTGKIRASDVTDFSAAHQHVKSAQNFFGGSEGVVAVELEQVNVVGLHATQAAFDRVDQMKARRTYVIGGRAGLEMGFLGGRRDFFSWWAGGGRRVLL